jgi:hypothetical protein
MSVTWGSPEWGKPGQNVTYAANGSYDGAGDKGEGVSDQ